MNGAGAYLYTTPRPRHARRQQCRLRTWNIASASLATKLSPDRPTGLSLYLHKKTLRKSLSQQKHDSRLHVQQVTGVQQQSIRQEKCVGSGQLCTAVLPSSPAPCRCSATPLRSTCRAPLETLQTGNSAGRAPLGEAACDGVSRRQLQHGVDHAGGHQGRGVRGLADVVAHCQPLRDRLVSQPHRQHACGLKQ